MRMEGKAVIQSLLLVFISILVGLLLMEGLIQIVSPQFLRPSIRETVDGVTVLRAGMQARYYSPDEYDTIATTNAQRFRATRNYELKPSPGTYRIAILGDSITFGTGANDEETYPFLLETLLNRSTTGLNADVLNAGIHGTGTGDQAIWFTRGVSKFNPDLVILTIFGGNDVDDEARSGKFLLQQDGTAEPLGVQKLSEKSADKARLQRVAMGIPGYDFLTQHSHLLYFVRTYATLLLTGIRNQDAMELAPDVIEKTLDLIMAEIRWLQSKARASGSDIAIVFVPPREFFDESNQVTITKPAHALANRLGIESELSHIPFLNMTNVFAMHMDRNDNPIYYKHDFHLTPDGNRLIAEYVAEFLISNNIIDEKALMDIMNSVL